MKNILRKFVGAMIISPIVILLIVSSIKEYGLEFAEVLLALVIAPILVILFILGLYLILD